MYHDACLVRNLVFFSFADSYINQTKADADASAELAVKRKHATYFRGEHSTVFRVETFSVWCKQGKELIFEIGKRLVDKTGYKKAKYYLIKRLSMTIQRGNAASVFGSLPSGEARQFVF